MLYLWTWYDYKEFGIPNTNNALECKFIDLKQDLEIITDCQNNIGKYLQISILKRHLNNKKNI